MLTIKYGTTFHYIDVTEIANDLKKDGIIFIPSGDINRANLFSDPLSGILKSIFIESELDMFTEYDHTKYIYIDLNSNKTYVNETPPTIKLSAREKLAHIHAGLQLHFGSFLDEFPEQLMATTYLTGEEKVLEIGGNIGRNSLIIGHILNQAKNTNFVSLESDTDISKQLIHNKELNGLHFFVENSALSKRKLIQKNWETMESDVLLSGYKPVNTITLEELNQKYNIEFDTLILDCEGSFYYILVDMPEILTNIKLIIMENDYNDITHKQYIDKVLNENNFYVDYTESGGWGPCYNFFFQVWKKMEK